jgi:hypothetical protein
VNRVSNTIRQWNTQVQGHRGTETESVEHLGGGTVRQWDREAGGMRVGSGPVGQWDRQAEGQRVRWTRKQ